MNKTPIQVIKAKQPDESDVWSYPNMQAEVNPLEEGKTNALGKKSSWRYEPPEEEIAIPQPPTAEEIEAIRKIAHDEGFSQGKEEGFSKGYEEGKAKGQEEGKAQGLEEGTEQGLAQGQEQIETLGKNWESLIEQLNKPLATVEKNVEEQLLTLVVQLTEAVVLQEAKINPDILMAAINTGIKALPSNDVSTQIYLNPDDIKKVEQQFGEQLKISVEEINALNCFRDFDHQITAPLHGFASGDDYYQKASSRQFLRSIQIPTLVIHAKDDPFMNHKVIPTADELSPSVTFELSEKGGHVGFVQGDWPWQASYYLETRIPEFLAEFEKDSHPIDEHAVREEMAFETS